MTATEEWQRLALWVAKPYAGRQDADDIRQEALVGAWSGMQRVAAKGIACTPKQAAVKGAQWAVADYLRRGRRATRNGVRVRTEGVDILSLEIDESLHPLTDGGIDAADARLQLWLLAAQSAPVPRHCWGCPATINHLNPRARYCTAACKRRAAQARRAPRLSGPVRDRERAERRLTNEPA